MRIHTWIVALYCLILAMIPALGTAQTGPEAVTGIWEVDDPKAPFQQIYFTEVEGSLWGVGLDAVKEPGAFLILKGTVTRDKSGLPTVTGEWAVIGQAPSKQGHLELGSFIDRAGRLVLRARKPSEGFEALTTLRKKKPLEPTLASYTHVLVQDTPYYLTGPQQGRPPDGEFRRGARVRLLRETGSHSRVRTTDGTEGWVATDVLQAREAPDSTIARLIEDLKNSDYGVRLEATRQLGRMGMQALEALPPLRHVADHDQDEYVRHFAKQAIQQIEEAVQEAQDD